MKTVSVDQLAFKENLTMIEQAAIKDILFKWVGGQTERLDDFLPLEYTESVFGKMEAEQASALFLNGEEQFRYATITKDNQIVIGVLNSNEELIHRIISLDEVLKR